jgi:hypothetical protein
MILLRVKTPRSEERSPYKGMFLNSDTEEVATLNFLNTVTFCKGLSLSLLPLVLKNDPLKSKNPSLLQAIPLKGDIVILGHGNPGGPYR